MFSVVNVYLDHLKFCVACINGRMYVSCGEYNVVSNECNEITHTSHTRAPTAPRVTIQTENTTSITPLTQTHNILQHSKAKKTLSLTTAATQQTFPQTPTQSLQQT